MIWPSSTASPSPTFNASPSRPAGLPQEFPFHGFEDDKLLFGLRSPTWHRPSGVFLTSVSTSISAIVGYLNQK